MKDETKAKLVMICIIVFTISLAIFIFLGRVFVNSDTMTCAYLTNENVSQTFTMQVEALMFC